MTLSHPECHGSEDQVHGEKAEEEAGDEAVDGHERGQSCDGQTCQTSPVGRGELQGLQGVG